MDKSIQINEWLLQRNISKEIIDYSGVYFDGIHIVIPVKDFEGNQIFVKKRKDPFDNTSNTPKYTYEKGSTSSLFNIHTIFGKKNENIFICEGELDCLLLNSLGFNAVSSTGGAGTFKAHWIDYLLNNNIYVVYDKDEAGIRGAFKVQNLITSAKIIFLPHTTKGKDITDYFQTHNITQFLDLVNTAESWCLPHDPTEIPTKKTIIQGIINELNHTAEIFLDRMRSAVSRGMSTDQFDILFEMIRNRKDYWERQKKNKKVTGYHTDDVSKARSTPISNFIRFNSSGFAVCLWHNETTPSMKHYPERGKVFCFGCNAHKDVIDVVQKQHNCDFNTALKLIIGKP